MYCVFSSGYRRTYYFRVPLSLLLPKQEHPFTYQRQGIVVTVTLFVMTMVMVMMPVLLTASHQRHWASLYV